MHGQYNLFFKSLKHFVVSLGLSSSEDFAGATDQEIASFEEKNDLHFDLCMHTYLRHFGQRISIRNIASGSISYTFSVMADALEMAKKEFIKDAIAKEKEIEGWRKNQLENPLAKIILLQYDETGSVYTFIPMGIENPALYYYWSGGGISSDNLNLITTIRNTFFWGISKTFGKKASYPHQESFERLLKTKVIEIRWLKYYKFLFSTYPVIRNKLVTWRNEYCHQVDSIEESENRLMGIDEFEIRFILYLIEEKEMPYNPNDFDPYKPLMTFEEYLS